MMLRVFWGVLLSQNLPHIGSGADGECYYIHFRSGINYYYYYLKIWIFHGFYAEENLVENLASMSTSERIKAIQKMPETMKKKREIR